MNSELRHARYFEQGRRFYQGGMLMLTLHGSWFQMGRQYGALLRGELDKVYHFSKAHPEGFSNLGKLANGNGVVGLHRYDEFYRGMAETSGFSLDQLKIIASVEVIYLDSLMNGGVKRLFDGSRCSQLAVSGGKTSGGVLIGRNYDWLPEFESIADTLVLAVLHPSDGANPVAMLNWAGCLYLTTGMNSRGLYTGLNSGLFASSEFVTSRLHNTWILWDLLLNCDHFSAVESCFATARAAGTYLVLTASPERCECFEWHTHGEYLLLPHDGDLLAATNHFATPGWNNLPEAFMTDCASSVMRRENLLKLADQYEKIGYKEMTEILEVPAAEGGAKVKGTMFQVIINPVKQIWYVRTKIMDDWAEIPLQNLLKGNGDLA